jgi:hypothetical protein
MRHAKISGNGRLRKDRGAGRRSTGRGATGDARRCMGLGDAVERWAKPVARWIDARHPVDPVLGLAVWSAVRAGLVTLPLAGCSACSRRRRWLNRLVPDVGSWRAWAGAVQRLCKRPA